MKRQEVLDILQREQTEARHLVESFRNMIAKQALGVWHRLPPHTKIWISVEDIIEDGLNWAALVGLSEWQPRKASLHTWLYIGIRTYFDEQYVSYYGAKRRPGAEGKPKKRCELDVISLSEFLHGEEEQGQKKLVIADRLGDVAAPEKMVRDCYVVSLVNGIYQDASPHLKRQIEHWFLGGLERARFSGKDFQRARMEFLALAKPRHLHYEECRHLMRSEKCLDQLSRELQWVPYDLNHPTPGIVGYGR